MLVDRMGLVVRRGVRVIGGRLGIPQRGPSVLSVCLSPEGREIESDSANDLDFASLADGVCGVVAWAGPIPVRIEAGSKADREVLVDLVRLVHRLGCASRVRVVGAIGNSTAMELVDRGLEELVGASAWRFHRWPIGGAGCESTKELEYSCVRVLALEGA